MLYEKINGIHESVHAQCEGLKGGGIRSVRGGLVERLVKTLWESLSEENTTVEQGKWDYQVVDTDGHIHKGAGGVDIDCYKNGELVCVVECKAYLDKCYLERAVVDFEYLQLNDTARKAKKIVVSLENSIAAKSLAMIRAMKVNTLSDIFFLCDGKRSSEKPLYKKEFFKPINPDKLNSLVEFFRSL